MMRIYNNQPRVNMRSEISTIQINPYLNSSRREYNLGMRKTFLAILVIFTMILSGCNNSSDEQISQAYTAAAETIAVQATSPPTPEPTTIFSG